MTHLILCLGMHRSGTSLIANSLKCLGVSLGPRAEWAGPDNPKGFGEDMDVLAIDQLLLRAFNLEWDDPTPYPAITKASFSNYGDSVATMHGQARRLLQHRLHVETAGTFALKEPRLCRLLSFWRPAIAELDCRVSVVHIVRHPLAVAASLTKRNGIPTDRGLALWLEYMKQARDGVDPAWSSVAVSYEAMMTLPVQQVHRIGLAFGLRVDGVATREFARSFVDNSLWHEEASDDPMPTEVETLWRIGEAEAMR